MVDKSLALHTSTLPSVSENSLESYLKMISTIPILSEKEELDLANKYRDENDLEAVRLLVMSHLRFVVYITRAYSGYGLPQEDLIQEGNIGLMKAIKGFNPAKGVRLISFAVHWIKAEIHAYILRNWRIVKIVTTKAQRKLFFNLRKNKKSFNWLTDTEAQQIAKDLQVSKKDVFEMEKRFASEDTSLDTPLDDDNSSSPTTLANYIEDESQNPALMYEEEQFCEQQKNTLYKALESIDERGRDIIKRRWLGDDKTTLQELADKYSLSAERIRQIENQAMKKIKMAFIN